MGFFELRTAEDLLEKAKRELARLEAERSIDHVYNFFVTAYHIVDYLDEDLKKKVMNEKLIQLCCDACNKAKHMRLSRGRPDVGTLRYSGAIGGAPLNTVTLNSGSERWIVWPDGKKLETVRFARSVVAKWEDLFVLYGIVSARNVSGHDGS